MMTEKQSILERKVQFYSNYQCKTRDTEARRSFESKLKYKLVEGMSSKNDKKIFYYITEKNLSIQIVLNKSHPKN